MQNPDVFGTLKMRLACMHSDEAIYFYIYG